MTQRPGLHCVTIQPKTAPGGYEHRMGISGGADIRLPRDGDADFTVVHVTVLPRGFRLYVEIIHEL